MARPKKPIDPQAVEKLADMGLSAELIGAVLDVSHHTIERRFGPILKRGREKRNARLMVKLYQEAMGNEAKGKPCNTAIAIFLAKNWLGMTDRPDVVVNVQQNAIGESIPPERLARYGEPMLEMAEENRVQEAAKVVALPENSEAGN
jgi:hypothetical protein